MKKQLPQASPSTTPLNGRLAAYLAAAGAGVGLSSQADAAVVGNSTVQPFGVNGVVGIDFNSDGQIDFQIDHDRVNLNGNDLDYLQIDKNDVSSAANPLPINPVMSFPLGVGLANDTAETAYMTNAGVDGSYPAALLAGAPIGPAQNPLFDFQETDNFAGSGRTIRANRLIDEDNTQIDQQVGGLTPAQVQAATDGPNFLGLGGQVRYLGVKMDFNDANQIHYGWIGIRIDNEADATGAVVGYAYQTLPNVPILAGIPEPGSLLLAAAGAIAILGAAGRRRIKNRSKKL